MTMRKRKPPIVNGILGIVVGFFFTIGGTDNIKPFGLGIIGISILIIVLALNKK